MDLLKYKKLVKANIDSQAEGMSPSEAPFRGFGGSYRISTCRSASSRTRIKISMLNDNNEDPP